MIQANELNRQLREASDVPHIANVQHGIRATVIGASQFTVQAGKTIFADSLDFLPLRNIPVIHPNIDLSHEGIDGKVSRKSLVPADEGHRERQSDLTF